MGKKDDRDSRARGHRDGQSGETLGSKTRTPTPESAPNCHSAFGGTLASPRTRGMGPPFHFAPRTHRGLPGEPCGPRVYWSASPEGPTPAACLFQLLYLSDQNSEGSRPVLG